MEKENVIQAHNRNRIWQTLSRFDETTRMEAAKIALSEEELLSSFGGELSFGTGGLRGILGVGTGRMNIYTVAKATRGLADYLKTLDGKNVAIAFDSRHGSSEFAAIVAGVLAYHGIHAWMYDRLMPTPALSFAVRKLRCDAGVMITASHNPAEYNGYKVYGADGCQITEKAAGVITAYIQRVEYAALEWLSAQEAKSRELLHIVPQAVYDAYIACTLACRIRPGLACKLHLVYTPLHGAGLQPVCDVLSRMTGITLDTFEEQCAPDGDFPTCPTPNPELKEALEPAIGYARQKGADLLIATDPDCDRVGVVIPLRNGEYRVLSGNEVGLLLLEYILSNQKRREGREPVVIKTIVTSDLAFAIAGEYGAKVVEALTGFKYIGEKINRMEAVGEEGRFVFGFEESCGYLAGTHVRDKDGVVACMLIAEMAQSFAADGKTLADALRDLYQTYGYMETRLVNFTIQGANPMEKMTGVMKKLRANPPDFLGNGPVIAIEDFLEGIKELPRSDVLSYQNQDGEKIIVRPSGTEPKVKVYLSAKGKNEQDTQDKLDRMTAQVESLLCMKRN